MILNQLYTYPVISEYRQRLKERKALLKDAERLFAEEKPCHGSFSDYKRALWKHRVSYREYMYGYEFWKIGEKERDEFISQRQMKCIYRKVTSEKVKRCFIDKKAFLEAYSAFVHRKWMWPGDVSFEQFRDFVSSRKCIAKPVAGSQGEGIFAISHPGAEEILWLWKFCRENNFLIEERVEECGELAEFHPKSLNTIRVVTMSGKGECAFLGALLRMGAGDSFIDNTHSGGIFSPIDMETGVTLTEGFDIKGNTYKTHPDSGKEIKGFCVPFWNECTELCKQAVKVLPQVRFAGWDICVLPGGAVELIEGNAAPNVDGGLQVPLKKGIKRKIQSEGKRLFGFDPVSLISVWSLKIV